MNEESFEIKEHTDQELNNPLRLKMNPNNCLEWNTGNIHWSTDKAY